MAVDLIADAVRILEDRAPRPRNSKLWRQWLSERQREISFFNNPHKSAFWCEAAGMDWEAVVSRLRAEGLFYNAETEDEPPGLLVRRARRRSKKAEA